MRERERQAGRQAGKHERIDVQTWSKIGRNEAILLEEKMHLSIRHKYTDLSITC